MQVCVFTEPHRGATFRQQLAFAQQVEAGGFHGFFRADHYLAMGSAPGLPGPTDSWITLGAIAAATSRVKLGTLVASATFRQPGPLAISVAQVDQMSGGRVELGIGAGWYEREHAAYGIPFPPPGERFERLEEQLQIIAGLWAAPAGEPYSFDGRHYRLVDAPGLPKPVQPAGPPIIIGGRGRRRTPLVAARYADEFNAAFQTAADAGQQFKRVAAAAEEVGRAAAGRAPLHFSAGVVVACGRTDAEARQRAERLFEQNSALPPEDPAVGSPSQVVERIGQFAEIGATRVYLRLTDFADLDHLELLASEVLPQLRS